MNSLTLDDEFGQIKIEIDGDTLLKHAHTDKEKLKEGDEVIVINFNEEKNSLLVRKFEI